MGEPGQASNSERWNKFGRSPLRCRWAAMMIESSSCSRFDCRSHAVVLSKPFVSTVISSPLDLATSGLVRSLSFFASSMLNPLSPQGLYAAEWMHHTQQDPSPQQRPSRASACWNHFQGSQWSQLVAGPMPSLCQRSLYPLSQVSHLTGHGNLADGALACFFFASSRLNPWPSQGRCAAATHPAQQDS